MSHNVIRSAKDRRIIAIANQKGGVGKTAIALNLGAALAEAGHAVLVIDLDAQGHLTEGLKLEAAEPPATLAGALTGQYRGDPNALIVDHQCGMKVIPVGKDLFLAEPELYQLRGREYRLQRVLNGIDPVYDYVPIDCPPNLGVLTDNALIAAGRVLVPVQAEHSSLRALELLFLQVRSIYEELGVPVEVMGLVANRVDNDGVAAETLGIIEQAVPADLLLTIRRRVRIKEAYHAGQPITTYEPRGEAAGWFRQLAEIVDARCGAAQVAR